MLALLVTANDFADSVQPQLLKASGPTDDDLKAGTSVRLRFKMPVRLKKERVDDSE